jgi:hypothetical protein
MGIACVSNERKITALAAGVLLFSSLSLGGCATSSTAGSSLMDARAEAAAPTSAYAPLGNPPPEREDRAMTSDERTKLKKDLLAVRDRQTAAAKAQGGAAPVERAKP